MPLPWELIEMERCIPAEVTLSTPPLLSSLLYQTRWVLPVVDTTSWLHGFSSSIVQGMSCSLIWLPIANLGSASATSGPVMLDALSHATAIRAAAAPAIKNASFLMLCSLHAGETHRASSVLKRTKENGRSVLATEVLGAKMLR